MDDKTRDRIEGLTDQVKGRGKSALGDLSGEERGKVSGELDQAQGEGKQGMADLGDLKE